jgi:hypothetical protein
VRGDNIIEIMALKLLNPVMNLTSSILYLGLNQGRRTIVTPESTPSTNRAG